MIRPQHAVTSRHVHISGYHGATTEQLRAVLDRFRADPDVHLITGTENYHGQDMAAWHALGWHAIRHGELTACRRVGGNLLVASHMQPDGFERQLTDLTFYRGTGEKVNGLQCASWHLQTSQARRVVVRWVHMPSGVQAGGGWSKTLQRVRVYHAAMKTWRAIVRLTLEHHPDAVVIVIGDWNLDHGRRWVRAYLRRYLKPLRPVLAHEGTLGAREVDVAWVHGAEVDNVRVNPTRLPFDHDAKSYDIVLTPEPRLPDPGRGVET